MELILCIFWVFASGSSSYLFLKRVHAVFFQERFVRLTFTALWVAGIGASTLVLPGPLHDYYQIANTKHCINTRIKSYVSAAFIVPVLFDALVFFAISYKILMFHRTTKPLNWKTLCCADALPHLSRAILQGGQQYYMYALPLRSSSNYQESSHRITTGVNVTRSILAILPNVSPVLQLSPSVPAVALTSAMACRVYRNLKLEAMEKTEVGILTTIQFADRERVNAHLPKNTNLVSAEAGLA